jgi:thioredoxin 1
MTSQTRMRWALAAVGVALLLRGCEKPSPTSPKTPGAAAPVANLATPEEYQQVLSASTMPVVIDFSADWCPPCRRLAPIIDELSAEWAGRVAFYRVDADKSPGLVQQMRVVGFPLLLFYVDGKEVRRVIGAQSKSYLEETLRGTIKT